MATIVAAAGGGNFTAGGTWVGGVAPTSADDAQLTGTSGAVTIDAGAVCRSLDCTGYTNTLTHNANATITIGDGTAGTGNIALKFVAGMTYTKNNNTTSRITFASTSATQQTITWAGKSAGNTTFSGVGSSYIFNDAFTGAAAATTQLILTNGILNTNGQNVTTGVVSIAGTATRTLTAGATTFQLASTGTPWDAQTTTNLTFNANTSSINITGTGPIFQGGGLTYNNVTFSGATTKEIVGANTFANLTVTGTAALTNIVQFDASQVITGTLTLTGNSAVNRPIATSQVLNTPITLTAAAVSITDFDFQDITGAGAAAPFTGTRLGDAQGNSGITFTTPKNAYWVGTTANWSVTNRWAATSGGATGANNYPLPQDTAIFDANSFAVNGNTVSFNAQGIFRHSGIDTSAVDQTFTLDAGGSLWRPVGSITLSSNTTVINTMEHIGRSATTFTAGGATISNITINGSGGNITLQDPLTMSALSITRGGFNSNGQNVSVTTLTSQASATLNMSTSTWTFTGTGANIINMLGTLTTANANIAFTNLSADTSLALFGARTFNNMTISGGTGVFSFPGFFSVPATLTVNNFTVTTGGSAKNLRIQSGATLRVNGAMSVVGASGQVITIESSGAGSQHFISQPNGTVIGDWLSIKDSNADGGANFYAGANSTSVSGNTGWVFKDGKAAVMMLAA